MRRYDFLRSILAAIAAAGFSTWRTAARAAGAVRVRRPAKVWDAVEFNFEKGGRAFPGLALRVPAGPAGPERIYAACRLCPHETCMIGFEINFQVVGQIVGKELANPVLFCRCHMSVFDPTRGGEVLNGPAKRVPWRFEFREDGDELTITALEEGAGEIK